MGASAKKILLIDDDREFVAANKLLLEQAGYEVSVAYDGQSGLDCARTERPELVILDIIMGSPDEGFELCRNMRSDESLKKSRLMVLTAVGEKYQMAFEPDGMWLPADRFLEKPIDPDTLIAEVDRILTIPEE